MKQGTKANESGLKLENKVESLIYNKLRIVPRYFSRTKERENVLLKNVPYTNIYGNTRCRSEFVCCYKSRTIRIECKTQHASGSVDEKLPYLYMNFTKSIPEKEAIIIVEGEGFKDGAKDWLRESCKGTKVKVMNLKEFSQYLKDDMPKIVPSLYNRLINLFRG